MHCAGRTGRIPKTWEEDSKDDRVANASEMDRMIVSFCGGSRVAFFATPTGRRMGSLADRSHTIRRPNRREREPIQSNLPRCEVRETLARGNGLEAMEGSPSGSRFATLRCLRRELESTPPFPQPPGALDVLPRKDTSERLQASSASISEASIRTPRARMWMHGSTSSYTSEELRRWTKLTWPSCCPPDLEGRIDGSDEGIDGRNGISMRMVRRASLWYERSTVV